MATLIVNYITEEGENYIFIFKKEDYTHVYLLNYMGHTPNLITEAEVKQQGYALHVAELRGYTMELYETVLAWLRGNLS